MGLNITKSSSKLITDINKVKPGFLLEHKGGGWAAKILGFLLKIFEPSWDGWGWHLSIAWEKDVGGWWILEATGDGVEVNYYDNDYLFTDTHIYKWFDKVPSLKKRDDFEASHIGKPYDVAIYFWTGIQYLIRHFFNRRIPRLLDDRFTCWELVFEFAEQMGKPIGSRYDCPMISDFCEAMND
jgi:hypothetical protein